MSRVSRLLNTTAQVWRTERVPDGIGGWEETTVQKGTIRSRFSQPNSTERKLADQEQARLTHVVYTEPGTDMRRGDELRRGTQRFKVLAIFEPSGPGTYLRADCEALQSEGAA